jgi:hypothetical protein
MNMAREWELRGARPPRLGWCQRDPGSEAPSVDSGGCRENLSSDVGIVASISNLVVVPSSSFVNSVSLNLNLIDAAVLVNSVSYE